MIVQLNGFICFVCGKIRTNCVVLGNVHIPPRAPQLPPQPPLQVSSGQPNLQNPQSIRVGNPPVNSQQNPQNSVVRLPPPRPPGPPQPQPQQPQQQPPFQQQQAQRPSLISNIFGIFG